ncbi:MAG: hypothetical protein ABI080_01815 [Candidatus Binatia bacterium]
MAGGAANFNGDTGILLQNSDGIVVKGVQVQENPLRGIAVDAGSDDNTLLRNDVGDAVTDVSDARHRQLLEAKHLYDWQRARLSVMRLRPDRVTLS